MSLDILKAVREQLSTTVEAAKARALDMHRAADEADKVADGHVDVMVQLDHAIESFAAQEAASISKDLVAQAAQHVADYLNALVNPAK